MKKFITLFVSTFFATLLLAQQFKGQWKGQFTDNSSTFLGFGGEKCDYTLDLETHGDNVTGYSYTYFTDGDKRYYTICKLIGKINKRSHYIEVTEIERTKTNVPSNIRNCFQIHKLTYFKQGTVQTLEGSWSPAPNQEGDCGYGITTLSRRVLKTNIPNFTNSVAKNVRPQIKPKANVNNVLKDKNKVAAPPPVVKNNKPPKTLPSIHTPIKPKPDTVAAPIAKNTTPQKIEPKKMAPPAPPSMPETIKNSDINFEKRSNDILKTIEIDNPTFKVDLYDNGAIDGDSISLFFNGKLLLSHKRLSDKAISLTLNVDENRTVNELVMYAENLGEIPPNTALMIVTDGNKRYEARISSDLEKSGVIRFIHKQKSKP